MIDVDSLRVLFGSNEVVKGVSFHVPAGGSFGIVGESGSGKSTVLRVISGLNAEWSGRIAIEGEAMKPRRDRAFFRKVQMVFQDPYGSLHPRQTIDRILSEPLLVHGIGEIEPRIEKVLAEVALPSTLRFRYPHQLSGGQRQRVAIARALLAEPRILILDDATSSVDAQTESEIKNGLREAMAGRTTFIVAHRLSTISLADEIVVLDHGRVVDRGTHEELLDRCALYGEIAEKGLEDAVYLQRDLEEREELVRL